MFGGKKEKNSILRLQVPLKSVFKFWMWVCQRPLNLFAIMIRPKSNVFYSVKESTLRSNLSEWKTCCCLKIPKWTDVLKDYVPTPTVNEGRGLRDKDGFLKLDGESRSEHGVETKVCSPRGHPKEKDRSGEK